MSASRMGLGVLGLCVGLCAGAVAQSSGSTPQERANELQSRYMTPVKAELTSKLDAKTAVAGQVLTARTQVAVTLADGTEIPAGTKLMGRVVDVHPRTDERAESVVTVIFDRADLKDGKTLPVRSLIRTMSAPGATQAAVADPAAGRGRTSGPIGPGGMGADPMGAGGIGGDPMGGYGGDPGMGGTAGSRGGMGGGGMGGGGMGGGTTGPVGTNRNGRQIPTQTASRIPVPDTASATPTKSTAEGGETVRITPKPTGVPGVLLYANPASDLSGMLMEYDKNIHLDSGVVMTLGVISRQPAAVDPVAK